MRRSSNISLTYYSFVTIVSMQTVSRLIDQFIPDNYQLSLTLLRAERTFSGTVTIMGTSINDLPTISVHTKALSIESVTLDGKKATFKALENDELEISHPDITTGHHSVVIAFSGIITDAMHGLYPCYYDHEGQKKELLATQFESHHAREVFPCIDEPEAKATFDVVLTTETGVRVLGNMPCISQVLQNEQNVTTFETTPRMSTYLLAWVVGELHNVTATTQSGVEVNIWATPAQSSESLTFALDIATRTIDFFDNYFGTPYPLSKSDHVALPDFSSGAMENWGLITYREIALLADPTTTSVSSKHYIATVIAHELSHQWFGNLVTMKWWNNLWLNESFATLMEYIAIDALQPDWQVWLDFATSESIMALRRDSIDGVQAVQVDVNHPDEISTLFDGAIVYAKGARLLRMLQNYIGHEAFQAGLKDYFSLYAYGNTEATDLWTCLERASGKEIASLMNTWIAQPGYPVVTIDVGQGDTLELSQKQFFTGPHVDADRLWPIPLNSSSPDLPELLTEADTQINRSTSTPVQLNKGDTAHFITHYGPTLMQQLINEIVRGALSPLDRLQLLHEQTLLARGGVISSADLIPLLQSYEHESTEAVWDILSLAVGELKKFVQTDEISEQRLRRLAGTLARSQYEVVGWHARQGEPQTDTKRRATIIAMMLYCEDKTAISQAAQLYDETPLEALDPELRGLIIGSKVRHATDTSTVSALLERYKATSSAELQQDIASGITSTRNQSEIKHLLELIKDESIVRPQDAARWFVWIIRNREGHDAAWLWLQANWQWIVSTFGGDKSYDDYPRYAAGALSTRQELNEYTVFFTPLENEPALSRVIAIGKSEIEGRVYLIEQDGHAVREALSLLYP
jgi:aminopeptidase N